MTNLIGQSLGRYHILEQLGEGGMATVYKAYDTRLEREVAVKVIRVDQFAPAVLERILKRFEREAKALARLTHPNIVGVIDYGEFETIPYLVMVYLPGGTLKQRMGKPIPWQDAVQLMIPIAKALDYAHEQGLIHRDVKPANILLTQKGQPMLTDFGIAKLLESEETATLTGTGLGIGTPEYMAPEQWTGKTTPQSDIYSLGVVFYELVTGRKPFIADTPAAILIKQVSDPLPHPRQYVPNLPEAIERVLFKALAKSAQDRYPDAGAFASALENLSGSAGSFQPARALDNSSATIDNFDTIQQSFTQPGMRRAPNSAQPTYPSEQKQPSTESAQLGRSPLPWIILGLVGIALVCALGGWLVRGGGVVALLTSTPALTPTVTVIQTPATTDTPPATQTPAPTNTPAATVTPALRIGSTLTREKDGMVMVYVPAGPFKMGNNSGESDEQPAHQVILDAFYMDKYEVTTVLYKACVSAGICEKPYRNSTLSIPNYYGNTRYDNYPVLYVNWNSAKTYCEWSGARLPTEAEWEKAARGTDARTYPWGNDKDCKKANFNDNAYVYKGQWITGSPNCDGYLDTAPVGFFSGDKSPYGVFDMAGNVSEWVNDWYQDNYYGTLEKNSINPLGPESGQYRVIRGNSYYGGAHRLIRHNGSISTIYERGFLDPTQLLLYEIGFRCAMSDSAGTVAAP